MAFQNPIVGGENGKLIRAHIQSPDYVPSVSGWSINRDGTAEFNNVTIRITADIGEAIVVGPEDGQQVVIASSALGGYIGFYSNNDDENTNALIQNSTFTAGDISAFILRMQSTTVTDVNNNAYVQLQSDNELSPGSQTAVIGIETTEGNNNYISINSAQTDLIAPIIVTDNELFVADSKSDSNFPARVVGGKVVTSTTNTPIGGSIAEIIDADAPNVFLESGFGYEVTVVIRISSSGTTSASGTQRIAWSLWQGAVGGTQLGTTALRYKVGAVASNQEGMEFRFAFRQTSDYTGTIRLGAVRDVGTNTINANVNAAGYRMVIKKIGDPAVITNL